MGKAAFTTPVKLLANSLLNIVLLPLRWQSSSEKESNEKWAFLCFPSTDSELCLESETDVINPDMLNMGLIYCYWGGLTLAGCQTPPSHSLTPPLEQHTGENKMEKFMGWDKDQLLSLAKLTRLGTKLNVLYCQLKIEQDGEKQRQKYLLPTLFLLPRVSFSPSLTTPLLSPLQVMQRMRNGELWSAHDSSSLLLLSSPTFPCSSMNSPLGAGKATAFHRIAFCIQVWTWNSVSGDTCSQHEHLINRALQLQG